MSEGLPNSAKEGERGEGYPSPDQLESDKSETNIHYISSHAEDYIDDPITLLHKQNLLASQLNAVNDRLARVNLSNQSPAPIRGTRGTPFPTSPKGFTHPVLLPSTQSPWHHRHTSSTFSAESMVGLGFDMSRSSMDTTPWTPYQSNVSGRYGMARDLHHTKSSPELGMNDERRIGGNRY
ncbi:hypothetical protein CI109_105984 [Kwoniella shandongensis]|uniref:Uncharacterized protein n=1 Tax=Kwoniella shandongensis TaxID=1734106 RepID=A0AAJ8LML3_9TREE